MSRFMVRIVVLISIVALLAGCNTLQGAGRDIKKAGEAVERAATRAKKG